MGKFGNEVASVYIIARSTSSDTEQLCYVETRVECLKDLSETLTSKSGIEVNDKMRFFHGDTPARQYECGQQKGGNYYCAICGASAHRVYEMDYVFRCSHMSLADRQSLVLKGPYGRKISFQKVQYVPDVSTPPPFLYKSMLYSPHATKLKMKRKRQ